MTVEIRHGGKDYNIALNVTVPIVGKIEKFRRDPNPRTLGANNPRGPSPDPPNRVLMDPKAST